MSDYYTTDIEDMEWFTNVPSREFLKELYKMLQANVLCDFQWTEHSENEEFEILADMVLQHLTYLSDKEYNELNGRES